MLKTVNKPTLLTWLKCQVEDAHERLMEDISTHVSSDWEIVNDNTTHEKLLLLINHDSPVTVLLAKQRLADKSVYDTDLQDPLTKMIIETHEETGEKCDLSFALGRLYAYAELYEAIGEKDLSIKWKSWAWFDPYGS